MVCCSSRCPIPDPDRLVTLNEQTKGRSDYRWGDLWAYSYPNYLDCKLESRALEMAAWRYNGGTVSAPGEAEHVDGREISSELFSVLGFTLARGRAFLPEEDGPAPRPWRSSATVYGSATTVEARKRSATAGL